MASQNIDEDLASFLAKALAAPEGFHFKIVGWPDKENAEYFNRHMRKIAGNLDLEFKKEAWGVAWFKVKPERGETGPPLDSIKRLSWAMVDPANRRHVSRLSDRALIGFLPQREAVQRIFYEALFKTALEVGPGYFQAIHEERGGPSRLSNIPSWALILAVAMISQINVAGFPVVSSTESPTRPEGDYDRKVASLFGKEAIEIGAKYLKCVVDENMGLEIQSPKQTYRDEAHHLEQSIQSIFESLGNLIESPRERDQLAKCCKEAETACSAAAINVVSSILVCWIVLRDFLEFRLEHPIPPDSPLGVAPPGLYSIEAAPVSSVPASLSASACWTVITTWSWPNVLAVANPGGGGAEVGPDGLARFLKSPDRDLKSREQDMLYHQGLMILISRCYSITNALLVLLDCVDYLQTPYRDKTASEYIQRVGSKDLSQGWTEFVKKDEEERKAKASSRRRRGNTGLNSRQRQVRRYMKRLALKAECLQNCLDRFRGNSGLYYELWDSESEGDSSEGEATEEVDVEF